MNHPYLDLYTQWVQREEVPKIYSLWCALGTVSAVMERRCWLSWENTIYPNQYIVLIGEPAARKGTALGKAMELLERTNVEMAPNMVSTERFIGKLCHATHILNNPKREEDFELIRHASLTAFVPELTTFIKIKDSYHVAVLTDIYDCPNKREYSTYVRGDEFVYNACFNMLAATTPDAMKAHFPGESINGGFGSRIIFVYSGKPKELKSIPKTDEQHAEEAALASELVKILHRVQRQSGPFKIDDVVVEEYAAWRKEAETNPPTVAYDANFTHYMGRRQTHLRKIMMAVAISRAPEQRRIILRDFAYAKWLLETTEDLMPKAMRPVAAITPQEIMQDAMAHIYATKEGVSFEALMRHYVGRVTSKEFVNYMEDLTKVGFIEKVITSQGVRYKIGPRPFNQKEKGA